MFGIVGRPERFAVLAAMATGKPVKMVYTREECFIDGLNRLPRSSTSKMDSRKMAPLWPAR